MWTRGLPNWIRSLFSIFCITWKRRSAVWTYLGGFRSKLGSSRVWTRCEKGSPCRVCPRLSKHLQVESGWAGIYFGLGSEYWAESTCVRQMWSTTWCECVSHCTVPLHRHTSKNSTQCSSLSKTSDPLILFPAVASRFPWLSLLSTSLLFRTSWSRRSRRVSWKARGCLTWPTFRWGYLLFDEVEDESVFAEIVTDGIVDLGYFGHIELFAVGVIEIFLDFGPTIVDEVYVLAFPSWVYGYSSSSRYSWWLILSDIPSCSQFYMKIL